MPQSKKKKVVLKIRVIKASPNKPIQEKIDQARNQKPKPVTKKLEKKESFKKYFLAEKERLLLMRAGIIFFMILILGFWLFNLKNIFQINSSKSSGNFNWPAVQKELSQTMEQIKENLAQINQISKTTINQALQSGQPGNLPNKQIEELKVNLLKKIQNNQASSSQATSTKEK